MLYNLLESTTPNNALRGAKGHSKLKTSMKKSNKWFYKIYNLLRTNICARLWKTELYQCANNLYRCCGYLPQHFPHTCSVPSSSCQCVLMLIFYHFKIQSTFRFWSQLYFVKNKTKQKYCSDLYLTLYFPHIKEKHTDTFQTLAGVVFRGSAALFHVCGWWFKKSYSNEYYIKLSGKIKSFW